MLLADFVLEFRFEYLWPFWLFIRSVYDSFRYQGLVSSYVLAFLLCFHKGGDRAAKLLDTFVIEIEVTVAFMQSLELR